ncbi:hypothetical protein A3E97_05405 [Candidatus Uhrbacteria bacterium RIFCSPHIGHO2_12_FULL_47_12]|uniref:Exostosin GT47 domain-containing protein n=1 Tax=Candidatus Uhrbacteria bacterium RIFCSPLOWO2_02_FULL_48_18 TaxID=1802408 RepID=A0A1F7V977_9BACT|nr:MAG: hypothetical protein A2839_03685 [Candidatus Uhrbacteria bacterium RIFCSPHIGHO2_01_FULL_47_10]OGL77204.1 MAG: hypothetical protein A3E97_05405 [Candidatus Uhrbacteria bacterium RIFCSPHIGHO2_12_FULL_47_12]OGL81870.1 MAG: hypothetical protein A3B20_02150 [Candidatus Uhrbacteria bacterium RIFCSPLOWO2_01_FULL_47_17]OGL87033.1 MAG: hypothetical protein A3I41_03740 [Candidatus Uhrbacteria bacterium RIFCSPLOWO2_02_FULL_48_18]OGL92753.1 MAG: hypothetical protein A3H12_03755 [Candidatus Uhrbacte
MMYSLKIFCDWMLPIELEFDEPVELYVDKIHVDVSLCKKILLLVEPDELTRFSDWVIQNHSYYHAILTHEEKILNACPNAHLMVFGPPWVHSYAFPQKTFGVSTVVGLKKQLPGHWLRLALWRRQEEILIPKKFYTSERGGKIFWRLMHRIKNVHMPLLGESKLPLFDAQFHIAIENCKKTYWFTEKLTDCFQTKTIPIYWGCPNIGNYFDMRGMILVESVDDIIVECNKLTPSTYEQMLKYANANYETSLRYVDFAGRVKEKIQIVMSVE